MGHAFVSWLGINKVKLSQFSQNSKHSKEAGNVQFLEIPYPSYLLVQLIYLLFNAKVAKFV